MLTATVLLFALVWLFLAVSRTFEPTGFQKLRALMTAISVPLLLLWFHNRRGLKDRRRILSSLIVLAIIIAFGVGIALVIVQNLIQPPEWDILTFWLDGQVGVQGLNFYESAHYQLVPLPMDVSGSFEEVVLSVGFRYPPQSMFLFLPLGLLDFRSAMFFWYAVQATALVLTVALLWQNFLKDYGRKGLVFAFALVVVMGGTLSTFKFGQTNFLAMLFLLLFWKDRDRARGGIWIILASYIKPFLVLLLIYPILRKNGRTLLGALFALIVTSIITIVAFGAQTFAAFIVDSPVGRLPFTEYTEVANQSILSTILRLTLFDVSHGSPLSHPLYLSIAISLVGITCWLVYRLREQESSWSVALVLMLALLVYPSSMFHYNVMLVAPLLLLWTYRDQIPVGAWSIGALIVVITVLIPLAGYVSLANLLLWSCLAAFMAWMVLTEQDEARDPRRNNERLQTSPESLGGN